MNHTSADKGPLCCVHEVLRAARLPSGPAYPVPTVCGHFTTFTAVIQTCPLARQDNEDQLPEQFQLLGMFAASAELHASVATPW